MTNIVALVRAWLLADAVLYELTDERISSLFDPADGYPAVAIGATTGSPRSTGQAGVDVVEDWQVALYCYGGRIGDMPDTQAAWAVASAVVDAAAEVRRPVDTAYGRIASVRVLSANPTATDPDTGSARATVTLALQVWR